MSYSSAGVGTSSHLLAAIFLQQAGLDLVHVPYKGGAAALPDVLTGRVDMGMDVHLVGGSYVKSGKLKALAVSSTTRLAAAPDVPTFAEQGLRDVVFYGWLALFAPAGTPPDVLNRLSDALQTAVASKELGDRYRDNGMEPMVMSSDEFNQVIKTTTVKMNKLVNELQLPKQD